MRLAFPLVVSAFLFSLGVFGVLVRRNAVLVVPAGPSDRTPARAGYNPGAPALETVRFRVVPFVQG